LGAVACGSLPLEDLGWERDYGPSMDPPYSIMDASG